MQVKHLEMVGPALAYVAVIVGAWALWGWGAGVLAFGIVQSLGVVMRWR